MQIECPDPECGMVFEANTQYPMSEWFVLGCMADVHGDAVPYFFSVFIEEG